ncbi:putative oxidoreductase, SDR family [Nocardia nova SH22a]|uniref:Putative oxidoreductase, SDR family n=1 Tax=Nocardia nova SH22a TaxID=1415166 RepID=W5TIH4_9NOCA|nr:mycofactocin-coupled SDR family oxidoreductase [Nocardia nova]AHH19155.1 putative oxidoreductase, SDR family [Nocardia nova SH22a]
MDAPPVAIVTGAARGIGAATVHRLAAGGWRVVAVDICHDDPALGYPLGTGDQLEAVAGPYGGAVVPVAGDVRVLENLTAAVELARDRFGRLDAAVAAAAVMTGGGPLWETTTADWVPMFDTGVHGMANLARAAVPAMLAGPEPRTGRFIGVASAAAHHGMWHLSGYNAAKHAVIGLIKGLAHDLLGTGITATAVSPGSTRTTLLTETARLYGLDDIEKFASHQIVDRILEPDEVAAAIAWLCTPESAAVTGSVVHADGGFLA